MKLYSIMLVSIFFGMSIAGCLDAGDDGEKVLRILSYDIYALDEATLQRFENDTGYQVEFILLGDAGSVLNRALQTKASPVADLAIGIDNTFLQVALNQQLFQPYTGPARTGLREEALEPYDGELAIPFDWGWVGMNYDAGYADGENVSVPTSLWNFTEPEWKGRVAVQNPRTSSPGRAFLAATVDYFRNDAENNTDHNDWWAAMADNEVIVTDGWTEAYVTHYSGGYGVWETGHLGDAQAVVSYLHSPGAEAYWGGGETQSRALEVDRSAFLQVEYAGILKGAKEPLVAAKFIEFLLSPEVQKTIPDTNVMYPVLANLSLPEGAYANHSFVPTEDAQVSTTEIGANMEDWLTDWDLALAKD